MPSPPIQVFLTTIASQPALRQRQEYLLRILQVKKIPFTSYDLASDETAKRLWKRKAPLDKQQLPGILVGGKFPGTFSDFEEAVEYGELDGFLRLKEVWDDEVDTITKPPVQPIGVPGAMLPLQMTPEHLKTKIMVSPQSTPGKKPIPINRPGVRDGEFDVSTELSGYGLQGVMATEAELMDLVAELGLDGDEAGDLVKGLAGSSSAVEQQEPGKQETKIEEEIKEELKQEETQPKQELATSKEGSESNVVGEPNQKSTEVDLPTSTKES
ncbi:hypothetical protein EV361DRAFT_37453 [Lentinula raphanica]|uniref:Thioredoxin-like protein n=1 Tax=Lentinula raphanica TaxID=153919 RepID=A0AA38U772_9AGAR|nr:hypothetical protein EV360DRAFT_86849 [Lentinula raphanica]KAJ3779067.1 hypothetical protein FB446DRAFT_710879 [Lentinula raphanica]KAJ3829804.1 hypothetical protein F5880DRAFT_1520187 [Lentinula raphanica]KAJ3833637.1 hypothetical protein F5878DRAFT_632435 [Lentinula raphanica]KAJ3973738.1 hypothetical protein EV361DRAFT_37453 [Lentinula raphanica]